MVLRRTTAITVHLQGKNGLVTACCGQPIADLPLSDRTTEYPAAVTCPGPPIGEPDAPR